jgi:LCP family protein required for cell wall assembly
VFLPGYGNYFRLPFCVATRPTLPAPRADRGPVEPPRKPRTTRTRLAFRRTIAIVVVLLLIGVGYVAFNYQSFIAGITHVNALVPGGKSSGKAQNILLVGDDHRPAGATAAELAQLGTTEDGGGTETDTVMVLHIPADGQNPTLISLPRDSWVNVPGAGMHKLNSAFAIGEATGGDAGGAQMLVRVVQNLTGLTINHYVRISLLGFYNVVNALGPVTVCLNHAVDDPYSGVDLPAGVSTLDAQEALAFVRQRHGLAGGDLDREIRQQYFLSIEAHNILSAGTLLNPVKLHNVLSAVSSSIETDPGLNLPDLAAQVKGFAGHLSSTTIPIVGTPTITVNGAYVSIVQVNTAAIPAFIAAIVHPKPVAKNTAAAAPSPSSISLAVLNGRQVIGAAATASAALKQAGFTVGTPADAIEQETTTVNFPKGDAAQAAVVATYLPGAKPKLTAGLGHIEVVLGTDAIVVNAAAGDAAAQPPASTPGASRSYTPQSCIN